MQLPLTKSPLLRAGALCIAGLFLAAVTAPHPVQAQSRRAKASSSYPNAKIQALQTRRRKAIATFNAAADVVNQRAVFIVEGKIRGGDTSRLEIYGKTYGQNRAAASALGQNNEENFLVVRNADPQRIIQGTYQGHCIALSQTEFTPAPAAYFQAVATLDKYREIIESLESEIEFEKQAGQQAVRKREQAKVARVQQVQTAQRNRVYLARVALANKEAAAKLTQLDGVVANTSDKGSAYLQSSAAATALFNKWGSLGVPTRALMERAFDDLASAAAWQLDRGDWTGAMQSAEKLLSLEVLAKDPSNAKTGKARIELGVDSENPQMPSNAVGSVMHRNGKEPVAATKLAQVWLSKLPAYIAGPATRGEKLRVAELSQLLGTEVFALDAGRSRTIAQAVDALRGTYGPGTLVVAPQFVPIVEAAKRERVARQVEAFSQTKAADAPTAVPGAVLTGAGPAWMDREPAEDALPPAAPATAAARPTAPQVPVAPQMQVPAEKPAPKPVAPPLVPALDFTMRSMRTGKKARLSDFKGKTVLLYFWSSGEERSAMSPTPSQQLAALVKRYDPKQVVLLLVDENGELNGDLNGAGPNKGPSLLPGETYSLEFGVPRTASDVPPERVVAEQALAFYTGNSNPSKNANRVVVISPAQQVVGAVDFQYDATASVFNANQRHLEDYQVYDFDEAALEDLLVRAMAPQP